MNTAEERRPLVLVAEDDTGTRELYAACLRAAGFHVVEARDGADARLLVQIGMPDLIVTDLGMPCVDGEEFCRQVRRLPEAARTPILAITGGTSANTAQLITDAGFCGLVCKPVDPDDLIALVALFLKRRATCTGCWERDGAVHATAMLGCPPFQLRSSCAVGLALDATPGHTGGPRAGA